jgi:hypothetical protein
LVGGNGGAGGGIEFGHAITAAIRDPNAGTVKTEKTRR